MQTDHILHDDIKGTGKREYKQNKQNYNLQAKITISTSLNNKTLNTRCWIRFINCSRIVDRITNFAKLRHIITFFTKRLHGYKNLTYRDRLTKLALPSLEPRRLHLDLIVINFFGLIKLNFSDFLVFLTAHQRACLQTLQIKKYGVGTWIRVRNVHSSAPIAR